MRGASWRRWAAGSGAVRCSQGTRTRTSPRTNNTRSDDDGRRNTDQTSCKVERREKKMTASHKRERAPWRGEEERTSTALLKEIPPCMRHSHSPKTDCSHLRQRLAAFQHARVRSPRRPRIQHPVCHSLDACALPSLPASRCPIEATPTPLELVSGANALSFLVSDALHRDILAWKEASIRATFPNRDTS